MIFEADVMREYDDDIRPYVPVLQRLIILVAVVVAVPVVLWTITAFIRTYIGPPHAPNYQHIAVLQPADSSPVGPPQDITPTAAATPAPAADQAPTPSPPAQPMIAPAVADQTTSQAPSQAMPAPAPAATPASTPPMAWAGSVMMPPSTQSAPDTPAVAAAADQTTASNDDTAPPAVTPIAGHVPLPRRRPNVVAMAQTSALQPTLAANSPAPAAGVPLPRARPTAAPEPAPDTTSDAPTFNMEQAH
jgi:hypothetical protein